MEFKSSISLDELKALDYISFPGAITLIEDEDSEEYEYAIGYLKRQKIIGFDTESKPIFTPTAHKNKVALIQLSSENEAFLFRINMIGFGQELRSILSNPKIIKVGAAVHDDIIGRQRRKHFRPGGFIDLQSIAGDWGIRDKSVKKMSAIVLGKKVSKSQQISNWEADTLSEAQLLYAATDAWVCRKIYGVLMSTPKPAPKSASEIWPAEEIDLPAPAEPQNVE
ncbi:MAG: 3'-5' exonuclease domain-containing protein 2 [Bacteroidales bacterium]|nr:3'-5' exonuclease domain-containing protein 2 [Bacteroidales bacterium]